MEKLTNKVSVSLSSLDSEDEKCKSKPKVTFLLIILNFFVTAPMKKRKFQAHQNGEKYYLLLLLSEKLYSQTSQLKPIMPSIFIRHLLKNPGK